MATAKKTAAASGAKATYVVTSPLEHDQVLYEIGEEVDLTEAQAAPLLGHTVKPKRAD
jgi:hypothetical protein